MPELSGGAARVLDAAQSVNVLFVPRRFAVVSVLKVHVAVFAEGTRVRRQNDRSDPLGRTHEGDLMQRVSS
jgi:hypothetical protein